MWKCSRVSFVRLSLNTAETSIVLSTAFLSSSRTTSLLPMR
jgi:hypothetical protein